MPGEIDPCRPVPVVSGGGVNHTFMNPHPIELIKSAVTLIQCDFDARVKLIDAVKAIEADLAELENRRAKDAPSISEPSPQ